MPSAPTPERLVLTWDVTAEWQFDPKLNTEIEIRFIPDGKDATLVELQHRTLDRYGARRDEMRRIFDQGRRLGSPAAFAQAALDRMHP